MKFISWPPTPWQRFWMIAGAVLFLLLCIWLWGYMAEQRGKELALADVAKKEAEITEKAKEEKEAQKRQYEDEAKKLQKEHEQERAEWASQQLALSRSVLATNQATERRIAEALKPKTPEQVGKEAKEVLGISPPVQNGMFTVTVAEMQAQIAIKLDRDRLADNLRDTEKQLEFERQTSATLRSDLDRANKTNELSNQTLDLANKTVAQYKEAMERYEKVARKGKLRRVAEFSGKVGIMAGVAVLAAKAGN